MSEFKVGDLVNPNPKDILAQERTARKNLQLPLRLIGYNPHTKCWEAKDQRGNIVGWYAKRFILAVEKTKEEYIIDKIQYLNKRYKERQNAT